VVTTKEKTSNGGTSLKWGSRGEADKKLQNLLIAAGYDPGSRRHLRAQTERGVKEFRAGYVLVSEEYHAESHLDVDG
jgi:hypothetical protein